VWPIALPKASKTAQTGIIQPSAALGAEINEKSAFAWGKRASCGGFSANS
jgi:hypothetical protein